MNEQPVALQLPPREFDLACTGCGYGVARREPPERCPMCQSVGRWRKSALRVSAFARELEHVRGLAVLR